MRRVQAQCKSKGHPYEYFQSPQIRPFRLAQIEYTDPEQVVFQLHNEQDISTDIRSAIRQLEIYGQTAQRDSVLYDMTDGRLIVTAKYYAIPDETKLI